MIFFLIYFFILSFSIFFLLFWHTHNKTTSFFEKKEKKGLTKQTYVNKELTKEQKNKKQEFSMHTKKKK